MAMQLQGHCIIHCSSNAHQKQNNFLKGLFKINSTFAFILSMLLFCFFWSL